MKVKYHHKVIAFFLALNILQSVLPYNLLYASNNGPNAPEASGFESVNATDMVNLASGDMSYVLPLMDVGGLPISLSYHGGVPLDLESTWTGLGWNLNTGAINRGLNATPDDWKGGNSLDFIRFVDAEEIYTVNVGIGIAKTAEVGVGASWGSNKSLSGSVFASVGLGEYAGASASIDTNGNYSLGVSGGTGKSGDQSFGGGAQMSGNVNGGGTSFGVSAGARTAGGMTIGVGASLDGGMSASLGYSESSGSGAGKKGAGGAGSLSTASFSSGDWEISSKGWYIPIQIKAISLGFGKQKVTYTLRKGYKKKGYGILYSNSDGSTFDAIENDTNGDVSFSDYQNRYRYADAYEQSLPVPEKEFVSDYDAEREKLNFAFSSYDSYDVNASGISGIMQPKVLQNSTIYGLGYAGPDPKNTQGTAESAGKMRVYWHNTLTTDKTFGTGNPNDVEFYFNGQFTQNTAIAPVSPLNNGASTLQSTLTTRQALNNTRLKQGNYIEVFTNQQIKNNQANGLLSPLDPTSNGLSLNALQRNTAEYKNESIGGYKITAPDGKVYHFSQPVYHFEMVERNVLKDTLENHVSEKRQYSSYATHWILTAITGPDFVDTNSNNIADSADYGYWVRMDYGKWSDGYVWRNPTDKSLKDYTTNIQSNIGKKDFGTYQFGRKQLYYLDRVVSATHTAYFVKDLRYDSVGSDLSYNFNPGSNEIITSNGLENGTPVFPIDSFTYKRQMQLMLEKIVLVKNTDAIVSKGNSTSPLLLNTQGLTNYIKNYNLTFNPSGGFYQEYGQPNVVINNESGVYDVKDFENFNYSTAAKVIDLEYNYNLAVRDHTNSISNPQEDKSNGSPGTIYDPVKNPNNGKLCLKAVRFLGRNNFDFMPPYQFEYKGEFKGTTLPYIKYPANAIVKKVDVGVFKKNWLNNSISSVTVQNGSNPPTIETPIADARAKDEWGFLKDLPGQESQVAAAAWTMAQIKTPTGSSIDFEHEEDDFYTEAFSRRFWTDNLKFKVTDLGSEVETLIEVEDDNVNDVDFTKYFSVDDPMFMDLWLCRKLKEHCGTFNVDVCTRKGIVDITPTNPSVVHQVTGDYVKIRTAKTSSAQILTGPNSNQVLNMYFSKNHTNSGSNGHQAVPRGEEPELNNAFYVGGLPDQWTISYRLLSNKVPKDETGGGLRVKTIILKDEVGNQYKTAYYYNKPGTNRDKNIGTYKSSGITSYSPVRGQKFVPYQSELPSPGVMYEYVTMSIQDQNGNELGKTCYNFYTLQPVLDIFNEQIEMKDKDGTVIFKANVVDHNTNLSGSEYYLNVGKKIKSKSIKLDVNTSLIGQLRGIEEYNKHNQLMSKTEKKYISGTALKTLASLPDSNINKINRGSISESFQSMKSVYTANGSDQNLTLKNRFLSVSTKEEYGSVLQSIITTSAHGKTTETYKKTDPETGAFMIVETEKADGTKKRVERVPAYRKYPELGSKTVNPSNKHMLTQETMNITSYLKSNKWISVSGSISTWNKNWSYRDNFGTEVTSTVSSEKIWRKHKTFVLNKQIETPFASSYADSNVYFDWNTSAITDDTWKKTSEITRYNHFSMPVETKDINNNFASSKMADRQTKVIASGNARYTEMYYSGAEHVESSNYFEGEVQGANFVTNEIAHTGQKSVKLKSENDFVFQVSGTSGDNNYYSNPDNYNATFRPGKYKVSVWTYESNGSISSGTSNVFLVFNGVNISPEEIIESGCWEQSNYYIDIPKNTPVNLYMKNVKATQNQPAYLDDFRMHPVASTMNSFVYDPNTDELAFMLDANNMASAFKYDNAGRLIGSYVETENTTELYGGFKLTSQYKQKYKNSIDGDIVLSPTINNCLTNNPQVIYLAVSDEELSTFENIFKTTVTGGSGNYSYQYRWLTNPNNGTYTNWISGSQNQLIPCAASFCTDDMYNKTWDFSVKVTELNTNAISQKDYSYRTDNCQFSTKFNWADIQISKMNTMCGTNNYNFNIHLKDVSRVGNYTYEYAYYNPSLDFNQQNFIDVTSAKGKFCPEWSRIEDTNCNSGYRDYVNLAIRVTDTTTGDVSTNIVIFMGDASIADSTNPIDVLDDKFAQHLGDGNLVLLDQTGKFLDMISVNRIVR